MTRPLLELNRVKVILGGRPVLRELTWRLRPGQHWMILGRNGSGKSTFLRLARGELWPAPGTGGRRIYCLDGHPQTSSVGVKESFALVSPELQNRYLQQDWSLNARMVIESGVAGGDYVYRSLTPDERGRVANVADLTRVRHLLTRHVQELSTGELRRVLVARALAGRPRVLICDEIGDGLDAASRATLLDTLDDAARDGTQLLVSTHRGDEIPTVMTHRLVLEDGYVMRQGRVERGRGRAEFDGLFAATHRPTRATGAPKVFGPALIQIRQADVYLGSKPTLREIELEIRQGQHWAVLGPNGSGKSTLLKLIGGDVHPALGGRVRRFAFTPRNTIWQVRSLLGVVSPELQAAYSEGITVADVVASGFFSSVGLLDRPSAAQRRQVHQILATLELSELARRSFAELSYGEARRILLARALVKRPALVLFDEPFDGLDVPARRLMRRALEQAASAGATLVVVTHHEEDLPHCITHVAQMSGGRCRVEEVTWPPR